MVNNDGWKVRRGLQQWCLPGTFIIRLWSSFLDIRRLLRILDAAVAHSRNNQWLSAWRWGLVEKVRSRWRGTLDLPASRWHYASLFLAWHRKCIRLDDLWVFAARHMHRLYILFHYWLYEQAYRPFSDQAKRLIEPSGWFTGRRRQLWIARQILEP